jgi:GTPase SAR1 family protein
MAKTPIPTVELQSEDQISQAGSEDNVSSTALDQIPLKLIDDLREHGVDNDIELPQIIVCGNQSCGKSSVLEAISGLSFPRGDGFCTAFATELSLRRGPHSSVAVRIPSIKFEKVLDSLDGFGNAVEAAKEALRMHHGASERTIFKEKLQVHVSHPSWPPLTLVDLPGLIRSVNFGQDKRDITSIRDIVQTYMNGSKTIILAVVSGSDDAANQEVLDLAHSCDASGMRTIGVITKPDLIRPGTNSEKEYVRYARNAHPNYQFKHWHVVKNRDHSESCTLSERDEREAQFFDESVWEKELSEQQLGVDNLRFKLSSVLEDHIRRELPGVVRTLSTELSECRAELARLGPARESPTAQEDYLMQISQQFQDVVKQATDGRYDNSKFFSSLHRKLRALVEHQNDEFVQFIYKNGHTFEAEEVHKKRGKPSTPGEYSASPTSPTLSSHTPKSVSRTEFVEIVRDIQRDNRGKEFPGTFNPYHINILFHKQSEPWRDIARSHVANIWTSAVDLVRQAVEFVAGGQTSERLTQYLLQGEIGADNFAMDAKSPSHIHYSMDLMHLDLETKLDEILRPYETHHAVTHDPEYSSRKRQLFLEKMEAERQTLTKHISSGHGGETETYVSQKLSNYQRAPDEFASNASEILDLMQLYYKVCYQQ